MLRWRRLAAGEEPIEQIMRQPGKTARQIQHDENEDQSDDDLPRLGETFGLADGGRNHVDHDGTYTGAEDRRPAADRGPDHHRDGKGEVHEGRRGELRHHDIKHPGPTRDSRRHREEKRLVKRHVEAEVTGAILVVADRLKDEAGAGLDQQSRACENQAQRDGDEIISRNDIGIELEFSDLEPSEVRQPVEAVGDRLGIDDHETHQQHERQRDDRNEDACDALAKHDDSDDRGDRRRQHQSHEDAKPLMLEWKPQERRLVDAAQFGGRSGLRVPQHEVRHWLVRALLQARRAGKLERHRQHVGACAEEKSLTEVEDSGVSPRQRHRDAKHAEYKILGDAVKPEWLEHQRRAHDEGKERQIDCDFEAALVGHAQRALRQNRPLGLRMMIMITTPKTTALARMSLVPAATSPLISPRMPAENTDPSKLPTPPITTTMNPSTTIGVPMSGNTVLKPDIITPATPARPEPSANVSALIRATSMPQAAAILGLRMIARTWVPNGVRYMISHETAVSTAVTTMMNAR